LEPAKKTERGSKKVILGKDQKGDIAQRLDYIEIQLSDLPKFDSLDWKTYRTDRDVQRNVERLIENVVNATIDVAKIVLVGEDIEMPGNYRDIVLELGTIGVLSGEEAIKIAEYAKLRNILAHQYLDIKWEKISYFIKNASNDYNSFIKKISKKVKA
jgi:uncharacterized protein YutE (UPF0331/DUF86 family)